MSKLIVRAPTMAELIMVPPGAYKIANSFPWDIGCRNKKCKEELR